MQNKLLEHLPGLVYWKDTYGVYLGCNQRLAQVAGFSAAQDIIGKTDFELPWKKEAVAIEGHDHQVVRNGADTLEEERRTVADGTEIILLTHKIPLLDEQQNIIGLMGMSIDMTEYKKSEKKITHEMQESMRVHQEKSKFLTTISHELRTPITGILGMVRALERHNSPEKTKEYLKDINIASEHLLSLINDFLDISKFESGKMVLALRPFKFSSAIGDAIKMLDYQAQFKKIDLLVHVDEHIPEQLMGDERAIKQIIINLVGNAIKFTEKGKVELQAKLIKKDKKIAHIEIVVRDTGMGIPQDKLPFIFDQFSPVDPALSRIYGGTGLGLALCKNFIELMDGEISVESQEGRGTQFYCNIPLPLSQKETKKIKKKILAEVAVHHDSDSYLVTNAELPIRIPNLQQYHVLLVEDNPIIQKAHVMLLNELQCHVDVAERGDVALNKIMQHKSYDLIFMDLGLPDANGYEITQRIRAWEANHQRTPLPIVALTAEVQTEELNQCLDMGMDAVITKPIVMDELKCIINSFIKKMM